MPTRNPIAAFADHPLNTFFEVQDPHEKIKLLLRRHVITNVPWLVVTATLIALPFILVELADAILAAFPMLDFLLNLTNAQVGLLQLLYFLAVFYFALMQFASWFFNVLLVTNERILDLDFRFPAHRNTAEAQLEEVQDVRHTQSGFLAVLFDLGDIFIQTAGERQDIELRRVPKPGEVHDLITNLVSGA